jgi:WD40 repeat protein
VFDAADGRWQPLGPKPRHALAALTFNATGSHLFVRCADGSLHARAVPGDGAANEIDAEATDPAHDDFTPDGDRLVLANAAGHVRFWDPTTGEALTPLLAGGGPLAAVVTSADGRRVTAVSQDGLVRVWNLHARGNGVPAATVDQLVALAEVLAGRRVVDEHAVTRLEPDYQRLAWQTLTSAAPR